MTAYQESLHITESREESLRFAIKVFQGRAPFDILDDRDVDRLVTVFALVPEPHAVAQIWRKVDRSRDAAILKDRNFLSAIERKYRNPDEKQSE